MEIITSKSNNLVKKVKKLRQKKYRTEAYLIEGWHLFEEAVAAGADIRHIFVLAEEAESVSDYPQAIQVTSEIISLLAESQSPQGVVAVIGLPPQEEATKELSGRFLILEDIQDPGNVGTLIRTADAAGFDGVLLTEQTADIYNSKTLRAMQGSHFHLAIWRLPVEELVARLKDRQIPILASSLDRTSIDYRQLKPGRDFALVLGNEGRGISSFMAERADYLVHIPMPGQAESLNVAVAGGILIFNLL